MSRSPLRMLGRFIGHLLTRLSKHATSPIHRLMLTLQRDDSVELSVPVSTFPYLFKATYLGGEDRELELLFFTTLENDRDNFEPYNFGDKIEVSTICAESCCACEVKGHARARSHRWGWKKTIRSSACVLKSQRRISRSQGYGFAQSATALSVHGPCFCSLKPREHAGWVRV